MIKNKEKVVGEQRGRGEFPPNAEIQNPKSRVPACGCQNPQSAIRNPQSVWGFTMIETIIFIVIAGIFVPLAYIAFSSAIRSGGTPESITTARFIAEQKIEDITKDPFESIAIISTSYAAVPGYTGYQWKWDIAILSSSDHSSLSPAVSDYNNYKNIVVYVKEPQGFEYTIYTIVTKRPT